MPSAGTARRSLMEQCLPKVMPPIIRDEELSGRIHAHQADRQTARSRPKRMPLLLISDTWQSLDDRNERLVFRGRRPFSS